LKLPLNLNNRSAEICREIDNKISIVHRGDKSIVEEGGNSRQICVQEMTPLLDGMDTEMLGNGVVILSF
jgi:hypothetical protein